MEDLALAEEPVAMVLDQQARIFLEGFDDHWAFYKVLFFKDTARNVLGNLHLHLFSFIRHKIVAS